MGKRRSAELSVVKVMIWTSDFKFPPGPLADEASQRPRQIVIEKGKKLS
jgi:hypothetical protein